MKAAILIEKNKPLHVDDIILPKKLSFGQVKVKMLTSGLCGAQLQEIAGLKDNEKFIKSFIGIFNHSGALTVATFDSFTNDGGMVFIDLGRRDFELTLNTQAFKGSGAKLDSSITALIINIKSRQ